MDITTELSLEHAFDIRINFDKRWVFGPLPTGDKQGFTSVKDGLIEGPLLNGRVVEASGADWPIVRSDGVIELEAHYVLEASDGTRIYIRNAGYVHTAEGPTPGYFRCTPYFRAPQGPHGWLNHTVFVGLGQRRPATDGHPDHSLFRYYAVR
ncbi:MAG: DUF3237 domain-containing protein [Caulobacteraceae bacterium]